MKHTEYKKGTSKSSFFQALLLITILVIGCLGYLILIKGDMTSRLQSFISMDAQNMMRPLQSMPEEKKDELQKVFGGFWIHQTLDTTAAIKKYDCLELKDNGIIWQVITWDVHYPDGDTATYYHIRYGYLKPYSYAANQEDVVSEVRTIRQIFIKGTDTCFGKSQVDELWQVQKKDTILHLNRKMYTPYHGDITLFFPEGMIDLIDQLILNDCSSNYSVHYIVKERLKTYIQKNADSISICKILDNYFYTTFIEEMFSSIPYIPALPDSVIIPLSITDNGTIKLGLSKGKRMQAGYLETKIFDEIETWVIAPSNQHSQISLHYVIQLPSP